MDVLLILGAFQLRGSYTRALALAENFPPEEVKRVRLLATDRIRVEPERLKRFEIRISRHANWPVTGRLARLFLRAEYAADPPDMIDVQHRKMHGVGQWLARMLERPYVLTVHDYLGAQDVLKVDPLWCRGVVAISESVRTELLERTAIAEEQVFVIPSGVQPPEGHQLHPILPPHRAPVVGTAGPLEAGKGLQHFLHAAARIRRTHPDALFLLAGSGPEEKRLRRMAGELDLTESLTILPNLNDFGPALQAMDVFVLPAIKQGLGTIMLEAMARGLPVVGTESGGVFSVISEGETGLLVPPSDALSLALAVERLLDDPDQARSLGERARKRVLEHFHVSQMARSTLDLYDRATSRRPADERLLAR